MCLSSRVLENTEFAQRTHDFSDNKYSLSPYPRPGIVLSARDAALNQTDKNLCPPGVHIPVGETDSKHSG